MPVIEKGGLIFIPLVISVFFGVFNKEPQKTKNDLEIQMDAYEKYLDSCIIAKSSIIAHKAIKKDSTVKILHKENKTLRIENKCLKSDLKVLSLKPADTIVRFVEIRKGLFGREKIDTLN
jgi:hypothetical protein